MSPPRKRWPLRAHLILLLALAAALPLATSGLLSLRALRTAARNEIEAKNLHAANRAAELIRRHMLKHVELLIALGGSVEPSTHLTAQQLERVLKNHVLDTPDFRSLDYVDAQGHELATARLEGRTRDRSSDPAVQAALRGQIYFSPVVISAAIEPEMTIAIPVRTAGPPRQTLIATVNLTEMWALVETLALTSGTVKIVDRQSRIIAASGELDKERVFKLALDETPLRAIGSAKESRVASYKTGRNALLGAAAPIPELGWGVILEQPEGVAFAAIADQAQRLGLALVAFFLAAILVGVFGSRRLTRPLALLEQRTAAIAKGELAGHVAPDGPREVAALGESINRMSEDLVKLQDEIRSRERVSTFARFGAGLVHDLGTPIKALQTNAMLAVHASDDETRQQATERLMQEQRVIERYLQLVRAYARGEHIDVRPIILEVGAFLERVATRARTRWGQVQITTDPVPGGLTFYADPGFLERVVENLTKNAVEAMAGREVKRIALGGDDRNGGVVLRVTDTGPGISEDRIGKIFEPFQSTKANGLGIGLSLSKWIVDESGGQLSVSSIVGKGTTFEIWLPARPAARSDM